MGSAGEEPLVHPGLCFFGAIVERTKPLVHWEHAVCAIVALEILVVKIVEEIASLHGHAIDKNNAFKTRMALGGRNGRMLHVEKSVNGMGWDDPMDHHP